MRLPYTILAALALLLATACGNTGNAGTETAAPDSANTQGNGPDTLFCLDDIAKADIRPDDPYAQIFHELGQHRYVGFPYFKQENEECWKVCNELYGAYLYTRLSGQDEQLDTLVEWRLAKYLEAKGLKLKLANGKEYEQMEQFVRRFRTTSERDLELDEEAQDNRMEVLLDVYTNYYIQKQLRNLPENKALSKYIEQERLAWLYVKRAQRNLLNALYEGNAPQADMLGLVKDQSKHKTKADIDLHGLLTQHHYSTSDTLYEKLTDQFAFYDVYNAFIRDIKATNKVGFGKKIQALLAEQKQWINYIYCRKQLSGKLGKEQEALFDNATNRLQKWHIVQLKNRLKGYGYCSDAFRSSLLREDCSYTDFYKYVPMKLDAQF